MSFQTILDYAIKCVTENYANFNGRARRAEYWSFVLCTTVISAVLSLLYRGTESVIFSTLSGLFSLAVLVPGLAVAWRRLHDIGKSGAWYFLGLVPVVGWIILIVWYCTPGDMGSNLFGADPKRRY